MTINIPKQLQKPEFKFILLSKHSKGPFEKGERTYYKYNNPILLEHLNKGFNYGVNSGNGNLRILDIDDKELADEMFKKLNTFCVKTCGGTYHFYFNSDYDTNHVFIDNKGEFRAKNYYVVGPNCYAIDKKKNHEGPYTIVKDVDIQKLSKENITNIIKTYLREKIVSTEIKEQPKDTSRSGLEYRKIIVLLRKRKTKDEIFKEMTAYSKWKEAPEQYREHTYEKALKFVKKADITSYVSEENKLSKKITNFFDEKNLVEQFIKIQPIYYERKGMFWVWNFERYCWEEKDDTDILNAISKHSTANTIKNKTELLEAIRQVGRMNKPLPIKDTWVQFKNKIYDIETNEILEATPKYFVSNPIQWTVGISEDTKKIDELFNSWVAKEDVIRLYEICAFCIVPKYFIHSFFFLYAPPGYGKSTFANLLEKFVGKDNRVSTTLDRINKNTRFETHNWHKKLLIRLSEVNNVDELKNSSVINNASGEDPVTAEIKNGSIFSFFNYGKFVYPTNKLVKIDPEDGFGRRIRIIKFINRFEKEKDVINEISEIEFKNLAKKYLRIAKELWLRRRFTGDVNISERMQKYQKESKTKLERFIDENYEIASDNEKIVFDNFYVKLSQYYSQINISLPSKILISKSLKKLGYEIRNYSWKNEQSNLDSSQTIFVSKSTIFGLRVKGLSIQK